MADFPPAAPSISCDFAAGFTQADLLALFDRITSPGWLLPIKEIGPGYEMLQAYAKLGERLSTAISRIHCGSFILSASGGTKATVTVEFYRQSALAGAVVVKKGTVVTTSNGDRRFITDNDVTLTAMGGSSLAIQVTATAVASGWQWNVKGPVTAANGEVLLGEIDTVQLFIQDPAYGDPTILVRQINDASGGGAPMLDGLGDDRGLPRIAGESDNQYRIRVRSLPDTVSPDAMDRAIETYFLSFIPDPDFSIIETFKLTYQTCWDANEVTGSSPTSSQGPFDTNLFCYDDPRDPIPFRNRWLDEIEYRGTFIVVVQEIGALLDVGMGYDDTADTPAEHETPDTLSGRRGYAAYDVPSNANTLILQGGYDGFDLQKNAFFAGLFNLLQSIKPAGVAAIIELEGE